VIHTLFFESATTLPTLRHMDQAELARAAVSKQCPDTQRCLSTHVLIEGSHLVSANQAPEKRER
jgi:hypothetical protein